MLFRINAAGMRAQESTLPPPWLNSPRVSGLPAGQLQALGFRTMLTSSSPVGRVPEQSCAVGFGQ